MKVFLWAMAVTVLGLLFNRIQVAIFRTDH